MTRLNAVRFLMRLHAGWIVSRMGKRMEGLIGTDASFDAAAFPPDIAARVATWAGLTLTAKAALASLSDTGALQYVNAFSDAVRNESLNAVARAMVQDRYHGEILACLHDAGVDAFPYKGAYLESFLGMPYGSRPRGDIDIFIRGNDTSRAIDALTRIGIQRIEPDRHETAHDIHLSFSRPVPVLLELHTRAYADLPALFGDDILDGASDDVFLNVPVRRIDTNDLYLMLCHHYMIHGWTVSTKWSLDLLHYQIVLALNGSACSTMPFSDGVSICRISEIAERTGAGFQILAAQAVIAALSGVSIPEDMTAALRANLTERERTTLKRLEGGDAATVSPDWIMMQFRRSGALRHRVSWFNTLWPDRARIAHDTGVPVGSLWFPVARAVWSVRRAARALRAILGLRSAERPDPNERISL